eukprot:gene20639-7582_t
MSILLILFTVITYNLFVGAYPCIYDSAAGRECPFAVPSGKAWYGAALVLSKGISQLPDYSGVFAIFFGVISIICTVIRRKGPEKIRKYMPSMSAVGIAFVVSNPGLGCMILVGALFQIHWEKYYPKSADSFSFPIASGFSAG